MCGSNLTNRYYTLNFHDQKIQKFNQDHTNLKKSQNYSAEDQLFESKLKKPHNIYSKLIISDDSESELFDNLKTKQDNYINKIKDDDKIINSTILNRAKGITRFAWLN